MSCLDFLQRPRQRGQDRRALGADVLSRLGRHVLHEGLEEVRLCARVAALPGHLRVLQLLAQGGGDPVVADELPDQRAEAAVGHLDGEARRAAALVARMVSRGG